MKISLQKGGVWKRISAWLFDVILAVMLAMGFALAASAILKYDTHYNGYTTAVNAYYDEYEQANGVDLRLSNDEYNAMSDEEKDVYDKMKAAAEEELQALMGKDKDLIAKQSTVMTLTVAIVSIGIFLSDLVLFFVVPLLFKNGQTLGKKMFGLAVMRTNSTKITPPVLFVREMVGLFAIETMAVLFLCTIIPVGLIAAVLVQLLQIFVMFKTQTNSCIHDLLSDTVVVDFTSQRIFDTKDEMVEYLTRPEEPISFEGENTEGASDEPALELPTADNQQGDEAIVTETNANEAIVAPTAVEDGEKSVPADDQN